MPKAMIITVGTGETVAHGISSAIKHQNPNYIIFVVTEESKRKTLSRILQGGIMQGKTYKEFVLKDENDVEEIRFETQSLIESLIRRRYESRDIVIDYTSGTKAMSAGVVLAGLDKKAGSLVYVSGKRDDNGRVISGTEKVISSEPNRIYAEGLFRKAVDLFNLCQFDGCLEILVKSKDLIADSEFQNKISLLEVLASAYSAWDKFDLDKAFSKINDNLPDEELLAQWGIKSRIKANKEFLYKEKENFFCEERIVDLLENARRRGDLEKKCDDAVARLYRLMEYIAQFKIAQKGLYLQDASGSFNADNLAIDKLPANLKDKYLKYKDPKDNKVKLGLYQNYDLLFDLQEDLGKFFKENYEKGNLKKLLSLRNNSILAHGFNSVSEKTYKQMLEEVEKIINRMFPEIETLLKKAKFPEIKL